MKKYDKFIRQIIASQARIAKERDKLRDIAEKAEELFQACDTAYDDLQCAIDKLSEQQ